MQTIYKSGHLSFTFFIVVLFGLSSCQKVIDVDLNSTDPQIVIRGAVTDQPGPYTIKINQTVNFNESNTFPPISDALVVISDDASHSEILTESSPGVYTTSALQGVPGRTYTLSVKVNGKEYKTDSKMPVPIEISELFVRKSDFGTDSVVDVIFTDAPEIENYYRLVQYVDGVEQKEIDIFDDELTDGSEITYTLYTPDEDVEITKGTSIFVLLQSIDKGAHEFFRTAGQAIGGSQSPANPNTNLSNGALGYFSAYSVRSAEITVD